MNTELDIAVLREKSLRIRLLILDAIYKAKKGHIGGSFSIVEILISLFYGGILKFDPKNPDWENRDRFILSKGHAGIALYAVLADLGYFSIKELSKLNRGGMLGEHPDHLIPGVEVVSGSLGHGLPIASGMALADKLDNKKDRRTYIILGDGECYEGSVWEAAFFAAHHKLNNLIAIVDRNRLITFGSTEDINEQEPFKDKWQSFGWEVFEEDAHDCNSLVDIFNKIHLSISGKPSLLIAKSVKGKGVSFMENEARWHHGAIDEEKYRLAKKELEK
jgi:transketolase